MLQTRAAGVQLGQQSIFSKVDSVSAFTSAFPARAFHFSSSVSQDTFKDENLRDDLRFYFMNPCEKYRARKHIPWKLGVQVLKIIMITTQVRTPGLGQPNRRSLFFP